MKFKKVYIEISDKCGLKCSFCPSVKNTRGVMELELFERIVAQVAGKCQRVSLHILGDPCKLENLGDYLEILARFGVGVDLVTSGFYMDRLELLLRPPVRQVAFSLDAGFDRGNPSRGDYLPRILEFCALHQERTSRVFINLRAQDTTLDSLPLAEIFGFFGRELPATFRPYGHYKLAEYIFFNIHKTFTWADITSEARNARKFCHALSEQVGILSSGVVVPCCIDASGLIALGNLRELSLEEILNSPRAVAIKRGFERGEACEELCQKCLFPTTRSL